MGVLIAGELHLLYSAICTVSLVSVWMVLQLSTIRYYPALRMISTISHGMVNGYSVTRRTATLKHSSQKRLKQI